MAIFRLANSVFGTCGTTQWLARITSLTILVYSGLPTGIGFAQAESALSNPETLSISEIDSEIERYMEAVGATSATVAITWRGSLAYSKGYGFSDRKGEIPANPRNTMRIASCTKPFTAAAIETLIRQGDITADTKVFEYLGIRPNGKLADERVNQITIAHLLKHKGGWDRDQTFDPMFKIDEIKSDMRVSKVRKRHIVRYMWKQPLQHDPGVKDCYSNFGYVLLGLVIEKATGESYINSIRDLIAKPIEADEISISSPVSGNRKSREVHYPADNDLDFHVRDSASGLATNSETLCKFMSHYWLDGTPLDRRRRFIFQFGTHPFTTTTLMEQREDGLHYAMMLNSRRNDHYSDDNDVIRDSFNEVLDNVRQKLIKDR